MTNTDRHSTIRYWALRVIGQSYPHGVDIHVLRAALSDLGFPVSLTDLSSYVAYLSERGCAKVDEREKYDLKMITCTADGLDVIDGRLTMNGITRG